MRVLLFGRLADVAGWRARAVAEPVPGWLSQLKASLAAADADLAEALDRPGVRAAVDQVLVKGDVVLSPTAEVAFMPPMSGG
jgi:molybdopterin synthase sulfur carrier subunit